MEGDKLEIGEWEGWTRLVCGMREGDIEDAMEARSSGGVDIGGVLLLLLLPLFSFFFSFSHQTALTTNHIGRSRSFAVLICLLNIQDCLL